MPLELRILALFYGWWPLWLHLGLQAVCYTLYCDASICSLKHRTNKASSALRAKSPFITRNKHLLIIVTLFFFFPFFFLYFIPRNTLKWMLNRSEMVLNTCNKAIKRMFKVILGRRRLYPYCYCLHIYNSASKGLFRKPDWDVAASYYERAGIVG